MFTTPRYFGIFTITSTSRYDETMPVGSGLTLSIEGEDGFPRSFESRKEANAFIKTLPQNALTTYKVEAR